MKKLMLFAFRKSYEWLYKHNEVIRMEIDMDADIRCYEQIIRDKFMLYVRREGKK